MDSWGRSQYTWFDHTVFEAPSFFDGSTSLKAYLKWEKEMDQYFDYNHHSECHKVRCAKNHLRSHARDYWRKIEQLRLLRNQDPIESWAEMKIVLREEYDPRSYSMIPPSRRTKSAYSTLTQSSRMIDSDLVKMDLTKIWSQTLDNKLTPLSTNQGQTKSKDVLSSHTLKLVKIVHTSTNVSHANQVPLVPLLSNQLEEPIVVPSVREKIQELSEILVEASTHSISINSSNKSTQPSILGKPPQLNPFSHSLTQKNRGRCFRCQGLNHPSWQCPRIHIPSVSRMASQHGCLQYKQVLENNRRNIRKTPSLGKPLPKQLSCARPAR